MHNQTHLFPLFQPIILFNWSALIHVHHGWWTNFNFILLQNISKVRVHWSTTEEEEINPKTSSTISSYTHLSPALPNPCQSVEMSRLRNWFHPHSPLTLIIFQTCQNFLRFHQHEIFRIHLQKFIYHLVAKFEIMRLAQNIPFCLLVVIKWLYWETQQNKGIRVVKSRESS